MSSLLQTVNLRRVFSETGEELEILKGVNFSMDAGELVALTGFVGFRQIDVFEFGRNARYADFGRDFVQGQAA